MTPYRKPTKRYEIIYNKRLVEYIAECFNAIRNRFRCLAVDKAKFYQPEKATKIINVCSAIHNACIFYKENSQFDEISATKKSENNSYNNPSFSSDEDDSSSDSMEFNNEADASKEALEIRKNIAQSLQNSLSDDTNSSDTNSGNSTEFNSNEDDSSSDGMEFSNVTKASIEALELKKTLIEKKSKSCLKKTNKFKSLKLFACLYFENIYYVHSYILSYITRYKNKFKKPFTRNRNIHSLNSAILSNAAPSRSIAKVCFSINFSYRSINFSCLSTALVSLSIY
uniref:Putative nuclease HARBI1 n=1 Tax=Zeugodacus cucurbitae TaxID=28588 RepID=A0A0A1XP49_ZEUCU